MSSLKSKVLLEVKGKNIERFLHRLINHGIEILKIESKEKDITWILIYEKDYEAVLKLKTIYEIEYLDTYGIIRIKKKLNQNRVFLLFFLLCILLLLFLSHIITDIEIVHTDKDLRDMIQKELTNYGMTVSSFKKSFSELNQIKEEILEKHRDQIEWLEIENVGTKYIIRVEERKKEKPKNIDGLRNIVASKNAVLKVIDAKNGEVLKRKNDYVKKGEVVISGELKVYDEIKNRTSADGKIYGEVWYKTTVEYPLTYQESYLTGKKKNLYGIQFLNSFYSLFSPYKNQKERSKVLWKDSILPISFLKKEVQELKVVHELYTEEEAILKAMECGKKEMEQKLKEGEKILSQKNLKVTLKESKIEVEMFFTVLEDITDYTEIKLEEEGEANVQENRN